MTYKLRINFQNACCTPERRAGGVDNLKKYHDIPGMRQVPGSQFNRLFTQSVYDTFNQFDYSPTARNGARLAVLFEVV